MKWLFCERIVTADCRSIYGLARHIYVLAVTARKPLIIPIDRGFMGKHPSYHFMRCGSLNVCGPDRRIEVC
jgi:hypothetical protein